MLDDVKVLIALPTGELARRADFYDYYNALTKPNNTLLCSAHGQSPARSRNIMIRQALGQRCSHILFLDDDMTFPSNLLLKLLEHDKDMVSGLYLMRNYPHFPVIFDKEYSGGKCRFSFLQPGRKGLQKIINAGFGCVLIKTDVFRGMIVAGQTFTNEANEDIWLTLGELEKDHWCDDISFFLRANRAGYELYVDLDLPCGHMITGSITPKLDSDGKWYTVLLTAGSNEAVQFPQSAPSDEEITKNLQAAGVI